MKYPEIIKEIKKKTFRPVYFLDGEEGFFIDSISNLLKDTVLTESEQGFNQLVLYGKETDAQTVISSARRFPMMAPYQVLIVKEAQGMRKLEDLLLYVQQPNPTTVLVINYKHKKLDGRGKLYKALKKNNCLYFNSKKLYDNQIPDWIETYLKEKKIQISPEAVQLLAEYLGTDLGKIASELNKILINSEGIKNITVKEVEENIGINREYNLFELTKAMSQNNQIKILRIVKYFGDNQKAAPFPLLTATLYGFFNKLFLLHSSQNANDSELVSILGINKFFIKEYKSAARHYNLARIRKNLGILLQYDMKSKGVDSGNATHPELIKELVFKLIG